ncbi:MAG: metalloregulator ArsR/SmtB family transcription factor [Acidobacteria bacterium]|nr:metalloregulator ArsR/SmtB family transcription factor [Acidobacteriota bacterium]
MKSEEYGQVAQLGRAIGNGSRLELLELIAQAEQSVEGLARMTGHTLTTVSSHLQVLKAAGLVLTRRDRTTIFYRLTSDEVARLVVLLKSVASEVLPELQLMSASSNGTDVMGDAFVLDMRPVHEFDAGHIPGAVSIPLDELPARAAEVPTGRRVVV